MMGVGGDSCLEKCSWDESWSFPHLLKPLNEAVFLCRSIPRGMAGRCQGGMLRLEADKPGSHTGSPRCQRGSVCGEMH